MGPAPCDAGHASFGTKDFRNSLHFMEPSVLLLRWQQPAPCPFLTWINPLQAFSFYVLKSNFNILPLSTLKYSEFSPFLQIFSPKLCMHFCSLIRATCCNFVILLHLITRSKLMSSEKYEAPIYAIFSVPSCTLPLSTFLSVWFYCTVMLSWCLPRNPLLLWICTWPTGLINY